MDKVKRTSKSSLLKSSLLAMGLGMFVSVASTYVNKNVGVSFSLDWNKNYYVDKDVVKVNFLSGMEDYLAVLDVLNNDFGKVDVDDIGNHQEYLEQSEAKTGTLPRPDHWVSYNIKSNPLYRLVYQYQIKQSDGGYSRLDKSLAIVEHDLNIDELSQRMEVFLKLNAYVKRALMDNNVANAGVRINVMPNFDELKHGNAKKDANAVKVYFRTGDANEEVEEVEDMRLKYKYNVLLSLPDKMYREFVNSESGEYWFGFNDKHGNDLVNCVSLACINEVEQKWYNDLDWQVDSQNEKAMFMKRFVLKRKEMDISGMNLLKKDTYDFDDKLKNYDLIAQTSNLSKQQFLWRDELYSVLENKILKQSDGYGGYRRYGHVSKNDKAIAAIALPIIDIEHDSVRREAFNKDLRDYREMLLRDAADLIMRNPNIESYPYGMLPNGDFLIGLKSNQNQNKYHSYYLRINEKLAVETLKSAKEKPFVLVEIGVAQDHQ